MKQLLLTASGRQGDVVSYILSAIVLLGIFYIVYNIWKSKKGFSGYITDNPDTVFKSLSTISTVGETMSLAIIAMNNGWDMFSSFFRYGMIGIMEIYASFFFISSFVSNMNKATKDGYITALELFTIFFKSSFFFVFAFGITGAIHFFYIESLNIVYGVQLDATLFYPWIDVDFQINKLLEAPLDAEYQSDPKDPSNWSGEIVPGKISIAVIFLIYSSTLFNIFLVITSFFNYEGKIRFKRNELEIQAEEEVNQQGVPVGNISSSSNSNKYFENIKTNESTALFNYTPFITSMFGLSETDFKKYIYECIGLDLDTRIVVSTAKTLPGSDPVAKTQKMTSDLINSTPWGLQKLYEHCIKVTDEMIILEKSMIEIIELKRVISLPQTQLTLKRNTESKLATEKTKYEGFLAKQKAFYQMFIAGKREVITLLKSKKCPNINESINVFETDYAIFDRFVL